jgi:hypothetical protein
LTTREGRWAGVPNSRDGNLPFRVVDEFSTESLNRQPLFVRPPETNDWTSEVTVACSVTFEVVPVTTLVELVDAGWFDHVIPFSVHAAVTRLMLQVRLADGATDRNTLSVAVWTAATAGIAHEDRSNLTKLRLLVLTSAKVWDDSTWSGVTPPKFEPC